MLLSDDFLSSLLAEIDCPDYLGILLGGSYARGDATSWSDVDIACIVDVDAKTARKRYMYKDGKLVSIGVKSIEGIKAQLRRPESAIRVARGIGDCHILIDKDGSVTALLDEVRAFSWDTLREAARQNASSWLMVLAEMAQKIANELTKGNGPGVSFAVARLIDELTLVTTIAFGVLVKSDSTYYAQVEEAAGPTWAAWHRKATGLDGPISIRQQAIAALNLYSETVDLLRPMLLADHFPAIEETIQRLTESKLLQE